LDATKMIRSDWFNPETAFNVHGSKMGFSSFIYAAFPIPFIRSVQSIAMMNFLIFLIIFYFIKKFKLSFNNVDYFYLLFPSTEDHRCKNRYHKGNLPLPLLNHEYLGYIFPYTNLKVFYRIFF